MKGKLLSEKELLHMNGEKVLVEFCDGYEFYYVKLNHIIDDDPKIKTADCIVKYENEDDFLYLSGVTYIAGDKITYKIYEA